MKTDDLVNRIEMLEEQVSLHQQLISTLSLLTIHTLAMFDTSSVSRDIKSAVIQYWENTDPKKRTSH